MAAGRDISDAAQQARYLSLVALFEREDDANELLNHLEALNIETSDATIVRVDNSAVPPATTSASPSVLSSAQRGALTGAIIGGAIFFLGGIILYESGLLAVPPGGGLASTGFISVLTGAIIGALAGAMIGSAQQKERQRRIAALPPKPTRDGFLVVVKIPLRLAEQCESIARRLGAKEIIL